MSRLGDGTLSGKLFGLYGRLYLRTAGPAPARWDHPARHRFESFVRRHVEPLWRAGAQPRDLYEGFRASHGHGRTDLLADPGATYRRMTEVLTAAATDTDGLRPVDWDAAAGGWPSGLR